MCIHHGSLEGMKRPTEWGASTSKPKKPPGVRSRLKPQVRSRTKPQQRATPSPLELLCQAAAGAKAAAPPRGALFLQS